MGLENLLVFGGEGMEEQTAVLEAGTAVCVPEEPSNAGEEAKESHPLLLARLWMLSKVTYF